MLIHSICLLKNEHDIVARTLTAAAAWSDFIYVYDNGSTDGTWEIVLELSRTLPQVVPFRSEDKPFHDSLRRLPFECFRDRSSAGDWWCRLDADEIYIDSPREFLASVPTDCDTVWSASFQFYLTEKDAERYQRDPSCYADEVPVEQKCRYYINNWSEIRFFKYSEHLHWDADKGFPCPLTKSDRRRIRLKHYQYRSPRQIETRFSTRHAAIQRGIFRHETRQNWADSIVKGPKMRAYDDARLPGSWTSRIVNSSELTFDNGADYVVTEHLLPGIVDPAPSFLGKVKRRLHRAFRSVVPD